ncbi:tRNA (adenosine(37)-N6)-dimethylallyltransferase MiaA [Novosphingobium sp. PC22D]|uniref:tRNA (adenosine(37)-N6)-dimethylallyltransferase MiaA n=1 Tax=Novosphingobium sp. PC22D TaxID=1962403 RepID=UPI000BF014FC|nr:tRNA (adenosine(37)-N6)-dimethylallyltransferase MiaA [Novosphingobium sp. PC22D]PEQ11093.1 tRNA (adenosine(37)-N6)-dimethylallyltransferase MiaA [Novosphingobium sp. PC22D]
MSNANTSSLAEPPDRARPPLALIAGPTASGKSDCAVELALALERRGRRAVVINADSAQVYADLAVLSARPAPDEMRGIDHRLFGAWDGAQACSAADWAQAARREIAAVQAEDAVPILVGGTGLYIRTLLEGIAPVPEIDPRVREAVRALPVAEAHAALTREDPERAAALAPADSARISRALEVVRSTGRTLTDWQSEKTGGIGDTVTLHPAILLPDRPMLYARCELRFARMIGLGALEEVRTLLARGLPENLPVMRAIGVPEIAGFLRGGWSLAEAAARASQATRNYAKRQFTWLRHQPPLDWPRLVIHDYNPGWIDETILPNFGLT